MTDGGEEGGLGGRGQAVRPWKRTGAGEKDGKKWSGRPSDCAQAAEAIT
jgi:hypothetical protein